MGVCRWGKGKEILLQTCPLLSQSHLFNTDDYELNVYNILSITVMSKFPQTRKSSLKLLLSLKLFGSWGRMREL